jgi:hypothetical protein
LGEEGSQVRTLGRAIFRYVIDIGTMSYEFGSRYRIGHLHLGFVAFVCGVVMGIALPLFIVTLSLAVLLGWAK